MGYDYPLDVAALVDRVKKRGADLLEHLGMNGDERPDVALTKIVWGAGKGWFPAMADRTPHWSSPGMSGPRRHGMRRSTRRSPRPVPTVISS